MNWDSGRKDFALLGHVVMAGLSQTTMLWYKYLAVGAVVYVLEHHRILIKIAVSNHSSASTLMILRRRLVISISPGRHRHPYHGRLGPQSVRLLYPLPSPLSPVARLSIRSASVRTRLC